MGYHKYEHIFFDLDHTLWDFDTNSKEALQEIYFELDLSNRGVTDFEKFYDTYLPINSQYWARYHHGIFNKKQLKVGRFVETLRHYKIHDQDLAIAISKRYTELSPRKTALFPYTHEILAYLHAKYTLHIITNGFPEVQEIKMRESKLQQYFHHLIISEQVGFKKPQKEIFLLALDKADTTADKAIMIGDNINTDIIGARSAGIDQVFFNPTRQRSTDKPTYIIYNLQELEGIL